MKAISTNLISVAPAQENSPKERAANELKKAASMMESLFVRQLMKVMRESSEESGLFGESMGMNIYQDMFDGAIADEIGTRGDFGITQMLVQQLGGGANAPKTESMGRAMPKLDFAKIQAQRMTSAYQNVKADPGLRFVEPERSAALPVAQTDGALIWPLNEPIYNKEGNALVFQTSGTNPVMAMGSGVVKEVSADRIVIDHGRGLVSEYKGLMKPEAATGDAVLEGQWMGSMAQGKALSVVVRKNGQVLDGSAVEKLIKVSR